MAIDEKILDKLDAWVSLSHIDGRHLTDFEAYALTHLPALIAAARRERALEDALSDAEEGLKAVSELIEASDGVASLNRSEDPASWEELRTGGASEDWLAPFDTALDRVRASTR